LVFADRGQRGERGGGVLGRLVVDGEFSLLVVRDMRRIGIRQTHPLRVQCAQLPEQRGVAAVVLRADGPGRAHDPAAAPLRVGQRAVQCRPAVLAVLLDAEKRRVPHRAPPPRRVPPPRDGVRRRS
jgi:hypothetical protein